MADGMNIDTYDMQHAFDYQIGGRPKESKRTGAFITRLEHSCLITLEPDRLPWR